MDSHYLLEKLKKTDLSKTDYVVVGSGPLTVKGIRDSEDVDIIVTPSLWSELSQKYSVTKNDWGIETLSIDEDIEVLNPQYSIFGNSEIVPIERVFEDADVVEGIKFLNLPHLKEFKMYLGREKDLEDVKLIDDYLNSK